MSLETLPKIVKRPNKRLGRGHGSGKVKTSGRGQKGQNARGRMPLGFEGGQLSIIKRLPLLRGQGKNIARNDKAFPVPASRLTVYEANAEVTLETLKKQGIIDTATNRVKILGSADLKHKLTVRVPCSGSARKSIEKSGGTVVV